MGSPCVKTRLDELSLGHGRHRLVLVAMLMLAIGVSAKPASAQASAGERWSFQGGPFAGAAIYRNTMPSAGLRLAAQRGMQVFDLALSGFTQESNLLRPGHDRGSRLWHFEAMAGMAWRPNALSLGLRSGLAMNDDDLGDWHSAFAAGPHVAVALPAGSFFELRGEAGVNFYVYPQVGLGGPVGHLRFGIEARRR